MLYSVGFGHGDAIHLADLDPDRPGLELFDVHEEKGDYAWDIHDAATGEIIWKGGQKGQDNGRGMAANIIASNRGYEFWSAYGGLSSSERNQNPISVQTGKQVGSKKPAMNFRIYWDGDLQDELFDGCMNKETVQAHPAITKWSDGDITSLVADFNTATYQYGQTCNYTKATPCLQADILGDWREELIMWNYKDPSEIMIYTTAIPTTYRVPTLMHDHTYRMGICWQNTAYNQPPHLGYYLPDYIDGKLTGIRSLESGDSRDNTIDWTRSDLQIYDLQGRKIPTDSRLLTPESLPSGLYLIKQGTNVIKYNKK
jgi:rhamnogalacturonan endolyase